MSKKIYTDEPLGKVRVVKDFLPSPKKLALKKEEPKGERKGSQPVRTA